MEARQRVCPSSRKGRFGTMVKKKIILWSLVALLLAVLTVLAVFAQSGSISPGQLVRQLKGASKPWLLLAVLCMLGFIFFEGEAVLAIVRHVGYPQRHARGFVYSAADVYFSAITPSATGGQPASAFFMIRDGIPAAVATAALLLNLVAYTLAIVTVGLGMLILFPAAFLRFELPARLLVGIGFVVLIILAVMFYGLLMKGHLLHGIGIRIILLLHRIHLIRHPEKTLKKWNHTVEEYSVCVKMISGSGHLLLRVYLLNLLQRLSQVTITVMLYFSVGGDRRFWTHVWAVQTFSQMGSYCVPIPGGMGVADYLMLNGFSGFLDAGAASSLALLGRGLLFYVCVLVSGITVAVGYLCAKKRK